MERLGHSTAAMSTVVGTVLMLTISVTVIGGFAFVVMEEFSQQERGPPADLRVLARGGQVVLEHRGGPALVTAEATVWTNVMGSEQEHNLADLSKPGDPGRWVLGESVCVAGPDADCLRPAGSVRGVAVATPTRLLLEHGERGDPAASPDWRPDLVIGKVRGRPSDAVKGEEVRLEANLENDGFDPATGTLEVAFFVDGTLVGHGQTSGLLDGGQEVTVQGPLWTAEQGSHTVRAAADPDDTVDEIDETNNEGTGGMAFDLGRADPGHAYEDVACDGIYEIGPDTPLDGGELDDGQHATPEDGTCLVVPSSVGTLTAASFALSGHGGVTLSVDLTASTGSIEITSQTDQADVDVQGVLLETAANTADIRLTAGRDVHVEGATLRTQVHNQAETVLTGGSATDTIFVEGARFQGDTTAKAEPSGIQVDGTPTEGSVDNS